MMSGSNERGFAIVLAMFMTLLVSAVAASMTYVARTETESTLSYTTMAQTRYAAESGIAAAADYLLSAAYAGVAPGTATDLLTNYNIAGSPVVRTGGGGAVVLSTVADESNYPVSAVVSAFGTRASGTLNAGGASLAYGARARLLAMRQLTDSVNGMPLVLQTWEITGFGRRGGVGSAEVEVTAIIERHGVPVYRYAAFATGSGCNAISFQGGARTGSFDSSGATAGTAPTWSANGGNIGTNGNLDVQGSGTIINGTLSTPRSGFGPCSGGNVTAGVLRAEDQVTGGLVQLPQIVEFPTPPAPSPVPPTTAVNPRNCTGMPAGSCTYSGNTVTFAQPSPGAPMLLGNVTLDSNTELVLSGGTYNLNSLNVSGNARIRVAEGTGPVILNVAGEPNLATPIAIAGNSISNPSYRPENLQILYAGTGNVSVASAGTQTAALIYAPRANVTLTGNNEFYGAVVGQSVTVPGGVKLYYDLNLSRTAQTASNPIMSAFTWRTL